MHILLSTESTEDSNLHLQTVFREYDDTKNLQTLVKQMHILLSTEDNNSHLQTIFREYDDTKIKYSC